MSRLDYKKGRWNPACSRVTIELMKMCKCCDLLKDVSEFYKGSSRPDGLQIYCKGCTRVKSRESMRRKRADPVRNAAHQVQKKQWRNANVTSEMWSASKKRAAKAGMPHTISRDDIIVPEMCPVLGIPLQYGEGRGPKPYAPSLDRIVPEMGYVPGNVQVISHLANTMKNSATPEQLHRFAAWVLKEVVCP